MSDLFDLVDPLKRAVAVPGTFAGQFADTTDDDLADTLLDAFAEAQLFGFFTTYSADDDGIVTPDLTRGQGALLVIFAMCRILSSEIRNRKTHTRYEAKGAVFENDQSATMLVQLLKDYQAQKADLLAVSRRASGAGGAFYMADQYYQRAVGYGGYGGEHTPNYASSLGPY